MKRILIVDDIEENLYLLRVLLEGHGYEVVQANNGSEAIVKALTTPPDMVITDILMPVIDGYTLCRIWKADERLKRAPFIFYTATYTDPRDERLAHDMGADAFIVKPAEPEEFLHRIEAILSLNKEGALASPQEPKAGDETILKNYSETLIRKLEHKMFELERVNKGLEAEIAERARVESSLRESEELFRNIFHQHAAIKMLIDPETGSIIDANTAAVDFYGWPRERLLSMRIQDINTLPDDEVRSSIEKVVTQKRVSFIFRHRRADGSIRDVEVFSSKIQLKGKDLLHSVVHDITDRKRAEEALRESEERYRLLVENINDVIYSLDSQGTVTYVNPVVERISQYRVEDIIGKRFDKFVYSEDLPSIVEQFKLTVAGEVIPYEYRLLDKDGSIHYVRTSSRPIFKDGVYIGLNAVLTDITDRKKAEDALRENERLFRLITENMSDTIWLMDMNFGYIYVSPSLLKNRGYTIEELKAIPMERLMTQESYAIAASIIAEELTPERLAQKDLTISRTVALENYRKDGSTFWVEVTMTLLRDSEGVPSGFLGVGRDITDRKRIEQALVESELQYRTLADSGQALIWTSGPDKKCDYFNKPWLIFTGRTLEQEMGDGWAEGVHPDDMERCLSAYTAAFDRRESFSIVYRLRRFDGEYRWIMDEGKPRYDAKGTFIGYIGHCLDITEQKIAQMRLEELYANLERIVAERTADLEKANKELESFSYTVSHDLRAPLRHINGFLEMFRREMGDIANEKAAHYMDVINDAARRMGNLIDDLLSFSRMGKTDLVMRPVDMDALTDEAIKEFSKEISERSIRITRGRLPAVHGDRAMLRIVLVNLISNAVKFTARTENPEVMISGERSDNEYLFRIKDNGAGFDMAYADKLFGVFQRLHGEREFEGTGIGLATIKRIVQRHGGRVWAEGKVGAGASFYFALPAKPLKE